MTLANSYGKMNLATVSATTTAVATTATMTTTAATKTMAAAMTTTATTTTTTPREIRNAERSKRRFSQMNPNNSMGSLELSGENLLGLVAANAAVAGSSTPKNTSYTVRSR